MRLVFDILIIHLILFIFITLNLSDMLHLDDVATDKLLHARAGVDIVLLSFVISLLIFSDIKKSILIAGFTVLNLAIVKEVVYDGLMGRGEVEVNDFFYTVIPGGIMLLILCIYSKLIHKVLKIRNHGR